MNENKMKKIIKKKIDNELNHITFSKEDEVIKKLKEKENFIKKLLDYEIRIPVKAAVATILVFFIVTAYTVYPTFSIDSKDISRGKMELIKLGVNVKE